MQDTKGQANLPVAFSQQRQTARFSFQAVDSPWWFISLRVAQCNSNHHNSNADHIDIQYTIHHTTHAYLIGQCPGPGGHMGHIIFCTWKVNLTHSWLPLCSFNYFTPPVNLASPDSGNQSDPRAWFLCRPCPPLCALEPWGLWLLKLAERSPE